MIWLQASAVSLAMAAVLGLLGFLAMEGSRHFWPTDVYRVSVESSRGTSTVIGERVDHEQVPRQQLEEAGVELTQSGAFHGRSLFKRGNREFFDTDFVWVLDERVSAQTRPSSLMVVERLEWGNFYGELMAVHRSGELLASGRGAWAQFQQLIAENRALRQRIERLERNDIGSINYRMESIRLSQRRLRLDGLPADVDLLREQAQLEARYLELRDRLVGLHELARRDTCIARLADGREVSLPMSNVLRAYRPNDLSTVEKLLLYVTRIWEFLSTAPREANTEGGVYPAIFGTVMMVLLMSVMVTPLGVLAAVYLHEYARQGLSTRVFRAAVNNLAGVPSIVYGIFGLGLFVYGIGAEIDAQFFEAALPSPTFGTPGLLWASLTLALLTLPVVIVATEEGLARIPASLREGSLALGATRAETLWRVVLPMASPAMITGVILAVARAAGEVAPLMLVGVVKLAPTLPVDGNFPYLHVEQKFMHLGFHIYDVGFQSPNIEAARPLVYATALLLVIIIALLNFTAVRLRNRLRERYATLEG